VKTWARADRLRICGSCGGRIEKGEAMLVLDLPPQVAVHAPLRNAEGHAPKRRLRCSGCASTKFETMPPKDLPPLQVPAAIAPRGQLSFASVGSMARDWKAAAAGREPGEEG